MSSLLFLYLDVRDATRWPSFIYNLTGKRMAPTKHRKTRDKLYFWLCSTCQTWHLGSHSEGKAICLNMAVQSLTWQPNNNWRMRCLSSPDRHSRLHCYKYSNKQICYFCLLCQIAEILPVDVTSHTGIEGRQTVSKRLKPQRAFYKLVPSLQERVFQLEAYLHLVDVITLHANTGFTDWQREAERDVQGRPPDR